MTNTELVGRLQMSYKYLNREIRIMRRKNLIEFRPDLNDSRKKVWVIAPAGAEKLKRFEVKKSILKKADDYLREGFKGLGLDIDDIFGGNK